MGWLFGSDFEGYEPPRATADNIAALRAKTLENMVFFAGGAFKFGNVPVPVLMDGAPKRELIFGPLEEAGRAPVSVDGFYASAFEITNHDFDLYAAANDLELRPDVPNSHERQGPYPAVIAYHQAEGYCAWLAEITGQPFALPTSQQWEYAARSGGRDVAYATQDGAYDYLEQLYRDTLDGAAPTTHLPDAYPANPAGLFAMSSNLGEWVLNSWADPDTGALLEAPGDPSQGHRRVWRGASFQMQAELNSIYVYGAAGPVDRKRRLELSAAQAPFFEGGLDTIYLTTDIGARCVVNLPSPPAQSGFGREAGLPDGDFPRPFAPLPRQ